MKLNKMIEETKGGNSTIDTQLDLPKVAGNADIGNQELAHPSNQIASGTISDANQDTIELIGSRAADNSQPILKEDSGRFR